MVKHQPLQVYEKQLLVSFVTGIYGCRWKRYQRSQDESSKVRFSGWSEASLLRRNVDQLAAVVHLVTSLRAQRARQHSEDLRLVLWSTTRLFISSKPSLKCVTPRRCGGHPPGCGAAQTAGLLPRGASGCQSETASACWLVLQRSSCGHKKVSAL